MECCSNVTVFSYAFSVNRLIPLTNLLAYIKTVTLMVPSLGHRKKNNVYG